MKASRPIKKGKIIITIDLRAQKLWVDKYTKHRAVRLEANTLPVVKESIHSGRFHPTKCKTHFRTVNGNTYLENVIFFDRAHAIRTSRDFQAFRKSGRPTTGQIVLEADFGQILYETVQDYGPQQTEIRIRD